MEMFPFHLPSPCFPHCLPHIGSAPSPEGLTQHHPCPHPIPCIKNPQIAFGHLPCAAKERGSREGKGVNLMGRTAKQVQPKVVQCPWIQNVDKGKFCKKVDEGKVRACSMYHWKRAERKDKASIYYRYGLCHANIQLESSYGNNICFLF